MNIHVKPDSASLLASRAMLASVKISQWAARKVDKRVTSETNRAHNAHQDAGRYSKALLAKEAMGAIVKASGEARTYHYAKTLPWLDDGARILSSSVYADYANVMRGIRHDFESAVETFVSSYPQFVEDAKIRLNGMFCEADYPDAEKIRSSFAFEVRILPVPTSTDFRVDIGDAQAEDIKLAIEAATHDALRFAMKDAFERVSSAVGHMLEKLQGYKPGSDGNRAEGIFRDSLVNNIRELVEILPSFNLINDSMLHSLTDRLNRELCSHDAGELRENEGLRADVASCAETILRDVSDYIR